MTNRPEWFAPKRYGYGAGLPISWQGWTIAAAFIAVVAAVALRFGDRPLAAIAIMMPTAALLVLITARTTRGGWRWRWGSRD